MRFRVHPCSQNALSWRHSFPAPPRATAAALAPWLDSQTEARHGRSLSHWKAVTHSSLPAACSLVFRRDCEPPGTVVTVEAVWCHNSVQSRAFVSPRPRACVCVCVRGSLWPLAQRWIWRLACSVAARFVVRQTDVPRTTEWLRNSPLPRWTGCCSGETHFYKVFFVNVVLSFCFFLFWGF